MTKEEQTRKMVEIIAKAWGDDVFKQRLLKEPMLVLNEEGMDIQQDLELRTVENTDKLIHIILPPKPEQEVNGDALKALLSSPEQEETFKQIDRMFQIFSKAWDDPAYKQRLLADATVVLKEGDVDVLQGAEVRAVENTAKVCHIVMPTKPAAVELTDELLDSVAGGSAASVGNTIATVGEWTMVAGVGMFLGGLAADVTVVGIPVGVVTSIAGAGVFVVGAATTVAGEVVASC